MSLLEDIKSVTQIGGTIVGLFGLFVATSSFLQNLERSRRELASKLVYDWAHHLDWPTSRALALLPQLDSGIVASIESKQGVEFPANFYDAVTSVLAGQFANSLPVKPEKPAKTFFITAEHSAYIRYHWVRWLNRLEGTLTAWQLGAASIEVMKREFEPLVKGRAAELKALEKDFLSSCPVVLAFYKWVNEQKDIPVHPGLGLFPWRIKPPR